MNINDINNLVVKFMSAESILQKNRKEIIDDCEKSTHECRMIAIRSGCFKEADEAIRKIEERTAEVLEAYSKVEGMLNTIRPPHHRYHPEREWRKHHHLLQGTRESDHSFRFFGSG